ncbi:transglycosylase SLT domain-containing protein [Pyxidicoccus sp. MSG2]|uniref:transglycosylase SLT domain-containing protein n=1 Tax=Pyxidicoccus sp. MSG2 TaxID=2996790 RepID=UPI00226D43F7|nr:transglycosylase SLT domain-containing protein [Pyxidicoccus sp. MSG2]MCY1017932.1 transglycosylase SLT domain-containing protein [Pyxidicoccus sp. MSG2]
MDGLRTGAVVFLACASVLGASPTWAQEAVEETPGEVLSEEQLEALLDSPTAQPDSAEGATPSFGPEQLAPYFAEGTLAKARAEFNRGRYRRARALLAQEKPTLPVRFLQAQSALQARDFTVAADEFAALANDYIPLRDHCLFRAAQANEKVRRWELAVGQYRDVSPGSPLYPVARFSLSKVLQRRGDVAGALAALQELIDSRQSRGPDALRMKALLAICDLARVQGQYNVEHRALLEVWATSPLSREAQRAGQRLKGLPLPTKWRVRRAEALVELHRNHSGMELLNGVLPHVQLPDELACRAHLTYGRALRKERQHRRAIQVLTSMVEQCTSPEQRPQALYVLGYSQSVVDPKSAITTYATLARDYPEHGYADDALFFSAWFLQRTGDTDAAMARYEETARRYPSGNFASEALFRAFWLHTRRQEPEAALAALTAVEKLPEAARTDEALWRARYWHARMLEGEATRPEAMARYEHIAMERPAGWYGMLARSRLALLAPARVARLRPSLEGVGGSGSAGGAGEVVASGAGALARSTAAAGNSLGAGGLTSSAPVSGMVPGIAGVLGGSAAVAGTLPGMAGVRGGSATVTGTWSGAVGGLRESSSVAGKPGAPAGIIVAASNSGGPIDVLTRSAPEEGKPVLSKGTLNLAASKSVAATEPVELGEPAEVWPLAPGPLQHDARFAAGVELLRLGLPGAVDEFLAVDGRVLPEAPARLLYQTVLRTGRRKLARQVARSALGQEIHGPLSASTRPIWEATWPRAYRALIERYARASRVDPDLLQGLIREESRFNPRARSSTGALGLAQLMPATARQVADSLDLPPVGEAALLQPADNVRLGAAYLGQLLKHFGGNVAYAVAAYNAGPGAVERWRHALPQAELDEWVEHIAFEETRGYVKKVLGSYSAYKLLYANEPAVLRNLRVDDVSVR